MITKEDVAKGILEETQKELEDPESWCQGVGHIEASYNHKEQQCLSYALSISFEKLYGEVRLNNQESKLFYNSGWFLAIATIVKALPNTPATEFGSVIGFNDDPQTTHEDVMLVVKKAINELEEGE